MTVSWQILTQLWNQSLVAIEAKYADNFIVTSLNGLFIISDQEKSCLKTLFPHNHIMHHTMNFFLVINIHNLSYDIRKQEPIFFLLNTCRTEVPDHPIMDNASCPQNDLLLM